MQSVFTIEWEHPKPDGSNDPDCSGYVVKRTLEDAIAFCKEQWPGETLYRLTAEQAAEAEGMPVDEMRDMMLPTWTNTQPNTPIDENSLQITICEYNDQGSASPTMWRMLVTQLEEQEANG